MSDSNEKKSMLLSDLRYLSYSEHVLFNNAPTPQIVLGTSKRLPDNIVEIVSNYIKNELINHLDEKECVFLDVNNRSGAIFVYKEKNGIKKGEILRIYYIDPFQREPGRIYITEHSYSPSVFLKNIKYKLVKSKD